MVNELLSANVSSYIDTVIFVYYEDSDYDIS